MAAVSQPTPPYNEARPLLNCLDTNIKFRCGRAPGRLRCHTAVCPNPPRHTIKHGFDSVVLSCGVPGGRRKLPGPASGGQQVARSARVEQRPRKALNWMAAYLSLPLSRLTGAENGAAAARSAMRHGCLCWSSSVLEARCRSVDLTKGKRVCLGGGLCCCGDGAEGREANLLCLLARFVRHSWPRSHAASTPPLLVARCNTPASSYGLEKSSRTMLWLLAYSSRFSGEFLWWCCGDTTYWALESRDFQNFRGSP